MTEDKTTIKEAALARWTIGHQMFFVQIQTLITALDAFERTPSVDAAEALALMLLGSATSMEFAASFNPNAYDHIQGSMAAVDENFSGIMSADHGCLVQKLKILPEAFVKCPEAEDLIRQALEAVYLAHAHVCKRFVGDNGSMAQSEVVGHKIIMDKFFRRALKLAGITSSKLADQYVSNHKRGG